MKFYLSTIAPDAAQVAREYGLGLEIAEYCTAWNMDDEFHQVDPQVRRQIQDVGSRVLHGPYNELFPCAIDRQARALAGRRYRQAISLAESYGCDKVVIHGGYNPWIYYPIWYVEQSVVFWKDFLKEQPGVTVVLENVLEEVPEHLLEIVKAVDDPRLRLCLDIGHVNAYSKVPVIQWLEEWAPWLDHFHIHNNGGSRDEHAALDQGSIAMADFLARAEACCPNASFTLELLECRPSVELLAQWGML